MLSTGKYAYLSNSPRKGFWRQEHEQIRTIAQRTNKFNTNTRNLGASDGGTNKVDPGYNGELVTISDPDLVEALTLEYNEKKRLERERLDAERNDREDRAKWRKLEMEKYRKQQEENAANGIPSTKKKKKKKKKK